MLGLASFRRPLRSADSPRGKVCGPLGRRFAPVGVLRTRREKHGFRETSPEGRALG